LFPRDAPSTSPRGRVSPRLPTGRAFSLPKCTQHHAQGKLFRRRALPSFPQFPQPFFSSLIVLFERDNEERTVMEIIVRKSDLVKELQLVQGIVERKNSIPILSNVLAEARGGELRISATDLDVSLRCGCPVNVVTEGAITLQAKKLYEITRSLPESEVRLRVLPDSWAAIDCEKVSFK